MAYDVIVIGVGGVGSAVSLHLARRGLSVLGLDRFGVAHDRGSSHGETRIVRKAYFEHPDYVPLCERAYESWAALEAETGRRLYERTGLLLVGPPDSEAITGSRLAAEQFGVRIETPDSAEARERFPRFRFPDDSDFVFEPDAGFLRVEECVRAHVEAAVAHGATIEHESVVGWEQTNDDYVVHTENGVRRAANVVDCRGAYHDLPAGFHVLRKVQLWFPSDAPGLDPEDGMPAFYFESAGRAFYGFPRLGGTLKVAEHTGGEIVTNPLELDRNLHAADVAPIAEFLRETLPGVSTTPSRHSVCMYTMSPDGHFSVGRVPGHDRAFRALGLSGHGFKFTGVLGEALADLVVDGETEIPVGFLSPDRFPGEASAGSH